MKQRRSLKSLLSRILFISGVYSYQGRPDTYSCNRMSHGNVIRNYSDIYLRAVRILEDQKVYLDDSLTISKLSALTGTNRTYLSRAFSNSGINFPEYINRLRITNIKRRVEEMIEKKEDILLEDLAIMCGYGSARTMNRNFVKSEGITVYAYIKEIRCKL